MAVVIASDLGKDVAGEPLLRGISFKLERRDRMVLRMCRSRGVPVVITLGGGYAEPIARTVEAHANTFRTAAEILLNLHCALA